MKYAVIKITGKQYKVSEGDHILVDKLKDKGATAEVLLSVNEERLLLGKPILKDIKVNFKILNQEKKGSKIRITKFKAKSRYRRRMGFRPIYTELLVEKITS